MRSEKNRGKRTGLYFGFSIEAAPFKGRELWQSELR
jgi:hypothetical protein